MNNEKICCSNVPNGNKESNKPSTKQNNRHGVNIWPNMPKQ